VSSGAQDLVPRTTHCQIFIKQYGERRTGTNYVRNLLLLNFEEIIPLMHMLGDKHSAPVRLDLIWQTAASSPDPNWHFVYSASFNAPSLTTDLNDQALLNEIARLAGPVTEAFTHGGLKYVICAKHPYAWLTSLSQYLGWSNGSEPVPMERISLIRTECERFNESYRSWLLLFRREPEDTILVRYEDLIDSPLPFLAEVERRFNVRRRSIYPLLPAGHVVPAHWDYSPPSSTTQTFDPRHYIERRYLRLISQELATVINTVIDWSLMAELGYAPLNVEEFGTTRAISEQ
jgi:hypothetical protein